MPIDISISLKQLRQYWWTSSIVSCNNYQVPNPKLILFKIWQKIPERKMSLGAQGSIKKTPKILSLYQTKKHPIWIQNRKSMAYSPNLAIPFDFKRKWKIRYFTKDLCSISWNCPENICRKQEYPNQFCSGDNTKWTIHKYRKCPQAEPWEFRFLHPESKIEVYDTDKCPKALK